MSQKEMNERILDLLISTGLNWEVSKEPLKSAVDDSPTGVYGIFKKSSRQFLSAVGERYEPFQNASLAEAILTASDGIGLNVTRGGQLNNGGKVYLQASLPTEFIGKSEVKRWLTSLNSHDGTTSIGFGSSNTVVVCQNTFFMAFKELTKVRHTMTAKERVQAIAKELNASLLKEEKLMESFKIFSETELKESLVAKVIRGLFSVNPDMKQAEVSTRKLNQIAAFGTALDKEIELEGLTVWGLFNGVTRYTNHIAAPQGDAEKKNSYLMTGGGYDLSNTTYEILMKELGLNKELELVK